MNFRTIFDCFDRADQKLAILTQSGYLAVSPLAGRIVAIALAENEESLFYINPEITDTERLRTVPEQLVAGPGGDRLRYAPEYAYAWGSAVPDVENFSNYGVQTNEDPGTFTMVEMSDGVNLRTDTSLVDKRTGKAVAFSVERRVSPINSPIDDLSTGVRFAGYRLDQSVTIKHPEKGQQVDLWCILQMPIGTTLIVPTRERPEPLSYFNQGNWVVEDDHLRWMYGGQSKAKIGLSTEQVTGRVGAVRQLRDGQRALVVRAFTVYPDRYYCDGPNAEQAGNQIFQAWDGFGFGEVEYHTPAVGCSPLPDTCQDTSEIWAFVGTKEQIHELVQRLLRVQAPYLDQVG